MQNLLLEGLGQVYTDLVREAVRELGTVSALIDGSTESSLRALCATKSVMTVTKWKRVGRSFRPIRRGSRRGYRQRLELKDEHCRTCSEHAKRKWLGQYPCRRSSRFASAWKRRASGWSRKPGIERKEIHHFHSPIELPFTTLQRDHTTILFGGLTWKHERLVHAALESLGYKCESVPVPNKKAFQLGKEYGNNGQCNPTYFTVGQPGAVRAGPRSQGPDQGRDLRPLRLLHRRRLRPLPLRHVRIRVPPRAAQLRASTSSACCSSSRAAA